MTKIEQLLVELCPNGVEQKTLGEICQIVRGASPRPIKSYITSKENGVPWIKIGDVSTGAKYVTSTEEYITEEGAQKSRKVYKGDFILSNSMSFGRPYILQIDGCIHDGWLSISGFQELLFPDFLYYILSSSFIQREMAKKASFGGAVQNLNADIVKGIAIPVPPLPVQEEIVRILDELTEKTDKLISELNVELDERKKQYEYYKRQILLFDTSDTQWVTLGDIGKVSMCKRIMKSETSPNGDIPFYKIGTFGGQANAYISKETFEAYKEKYSYPKKGDILISAAGTIGRTVIFDGQPAYFQDSNIVWIANDESKLLNCFLNYYYQTQPWQISTGGTISRLYNDNISSAKIPLISKEEQLKIVSIMEKCETVFSNYTNSIKEEITTRKQQHEYYRDKLLTF